MMEIHRSYIGLQIHLDLVAYWIIHHYIALDSVCSSSLA